MTISHLPLGSAGTAILAMDVSNSMNADDVTPSRLAAAQQAALSFIDAQPDSVDIGVVGFDQGALTTSQPSADRAAAKAAVQRLRTAGGTSLRQKRDERLATITLMLDDVDSMIIECELYRTRAR